MPNDLGIVVIGRNEGQRLINCLKSVKDQTDAPIVYVDSGSTDGSVVAAERLGVSVVKLDLSRPFTAARARNAGFAALSPATRFVQFVDGDCELVRGWLEIALNFLRNRDDVAVACGRRREQHPDASVYNRLCDVEWNTPIGEASACGGDSVIRSDAFKTVGGYRDALIAGEEPELCLRLRELGWKIWRLDAEMTRHDAAITRFSQWWKRTVRSGYAYADIAQLHKDSKVRIYAHEAKRAVIWGGLLPFAILVGTLIYPAVLLASLIYLAQICRVALRQSGDRNTAWLYAFLITVAKFAELEGLLKYYRRRLSGQSAALIEYK